MTRFRVELYNQLLLMELMFVPYIWTAFISTTQPLLLLIVRVGTLYLHSGTLIVYLVNYGSPQAFTYADFSSLAIAKVWAGKADLPNTIELWRRYDEVVKDRGGYGKYFQFLSTERTRGR